MCKFGELLQNVKITSFYIFWDILHRKKESLGQECVKRGLYSSIAKSKQLPQIYLQK